MKLGLRSAFSATIIAFLPVTSAQARSTLCCADDRGQQVCSDILPPICYGRAYREISERGVIVRRVDAPLTAEGRAQRDAEVERAKAEERARIDQERRNRALLATYASEKDIDFIRDRTLGELERALKLAQEKYAEAAVRQAKLNEEAEFYKKQELPPQLKTAIRDNNNELAAHKAAGDEKNKEIEAARTRFDDEKTRWLKLNTRRPASLPGSSAKIAPADSRPR